MLDTEDFCWKVGHMTSHLCHKHPGGDCGSKENTTEFRFYSLKTGAALSIPPINEQHQSWTYLCLKLCSLVGSSEAFGLFLPLWHNSSLFLAADAEFEVMTHESVQCASEKHTVVNTIPMDQTI